MEGQVGQRITKLSQAKASNYRTIFYNIEGIKLIMNFGSTTGTYPEERWVNLLPGSCWTLVTDNDPGDVFSLSESEEVLLKVSVGDVPETDTIKLSGRESAASGKTCKNNKYLKRGFRPNSLCIVTSCEYDATVCRKNEQENTNHPMYQQAFQWKDAKADELPNQTPQVALITDISELDGKTACTNMFKQMSESRTSLHSTLDDLFMKDPSSSPEHE